MAPSSSPKLWTIAVLAALAGGCGGHRAPAARPRPALPAALDRPAIEWLRGGSPRERVLVGAGGVAVGIAGGPLARTAFASPAEAADLGVFVAGFAPFAEAAGGERLAFAGRGAAPASPAERRMIREWTRKVAAEATVGAAAGGPDAARAYGLALAWRGGALACAGVSVFLSGEVRASACDWPEEARGRLAGAPLARLYRWFDAYRPFQIDAVDSGGVAGRTAAAPTGIIFAGRGTAEAPAAERAAMDELAAALHRELAARRAPTPAPVAPPAAPTAEPQPAAARPPIPSPAATRPPIPPPTAVPSSGLLRPDPPPPAPPGSPVPKASAPAAPRSAPAARAKPAAPPSSEDDEAPQGTEPPQGTDQG